MTSQFGLSEETLAKIRNTFAAHPLIEKAVVYGSRAKGSHRPGSDIDLVIYSDKLSHSELMKIENELDDLLLPYEIDLSRFSDIEDQSLLEHIARVGQIFYLRDAD